MRTLLLTSVLPWPLRRNGGAQRTALLKRALEQHGPVDVLAVGGPMLRDEADPHFDSKCAAWGVLACVVVKPHIGKTPVYLPGPLGNLWRTVRGYESAYEPDPAAAALMARHMATGKYDLIVSRYLLPAMQCDALRHGRRVILDFDDIDHAAFAHALAAKPWGGLGGRIGSTLVQRKLDRIVTTAVGAFGAVTVTSEEDRAYLPPAAKPAVVLPNIAYSDSRAGDLPALPPADESREALFVGDLQFPPNREGLDRFCEKVWPLVRTAVPDATLSIVGRGLTDRDRARWAAVAGVNVIGFAEDLTECYRRCAMTIVPTYFGGGTKIKVLESLAFGRTLATTPHAMRGYAPLAEGTPPAVAVADTDADFAEACTHLLQHPALRNAMAARGRAVVEADFSFAKFSGIVEGLITRVMSR
jgi:glycosyltransferase involved in cell wall biosynthesis